MMKKLFCLLISLFMLGCSLAQAPIVTPTEDNPWAECPLLKYPVIERFQSPTLRGYAMFVHDLDSDGRADVLVTYWYDEEGERIYEMERFWLTGKYGFYFE